MTTPSDNGGGRSAGGYDYHFVKQPLEMFVCKICHSPSRDPHLSMCSGHTFCKSSSSYVTTYGNDVTMSGC